MMPELPDVYVNQFVFQNLHSRGKTLNVGSHIDGAVLGRQPGNVNIDIFLDDPGTNQRLPVHAVADGRWLPFRPVFDSVVLGEILEHMEHEDQIKFLNEARGVLAGEGQIVATLPHVGLGDPDSDAERLYSPGGIHANHYRIVSREEIFESVESAQLEVVFFADIHYTWRANGTGFVARRKAA